MGTFQGEESVLKRDHRRAIIAQDGSMLWDLNVLLDPADPAIPL
jgi:hypothetical protein